MQTLLLSGNHLSQPMHVVSILNILDEYYHYKWIEIYKFYKSLSIFNGNIHLQVCSIFICKHARKNNEAAKFIAFN